MQALVYDIEIVKAIQMRGERRDTDIDYCKGWDDKANMGVSCIGVYDYPTDQYRVFCADNLDDFRALIAQRNVFVGFNNISFDNGVLVHHDVVIPDGRCYDILRELWRAADLGVDSFTRAHGGFGLDPTCAANFGEHKTGDGGALAPANWQRARYGSVIDYCLHDVWLTKKLFDRILACGILAHPKGGDALVLRPPAAVVPNA